jgi:hypothetical protein
LADVAGEILTVGKRTNLINVLNFQSGAEAYGVGSVGLRIEYCSALRLFAKLQVEDRSEQQKRDQINGQFLILNPEQRLRLNFLSWIEY